MGSKDGEVTLSAGLCLWLAVLVLTLPLSWLLAAAIAALVHEAGHYLAIRMLSGRGVSVRFYAFAARMPLPEMSRWREMVCALAGPLLGLCLVLLGRWLPRTAICAAIQSIYNLMPIYPLDGGRALRCLLSMTMPPQAAGKACRMTQILCKALVCLIALYAAIRFDLGLLPLIPAALLLCRK